MNKPYTFNPNIKNWGNLFKGSLPNTDGMNPFTEDQIKNERSVYGGSANWVMDRADYITKKITTSIYSLPDFDALILKHADMGYHPIIDTRVTMLLNTNHIPVDLSGRDLEMYQAIPGWHCDGVIRKNKNSQPCPETISENVDHFIFSCSSGMSELRPLAPTQLISSKIKMDLDDELPIWEQVNSKVNENIDNLTIKEPIDGDVVQFNRATIHRSTPARGRGWRYFYRLSFYHMPANNEFRVNNNVYISYTGGGW
jgi:hypothetical protein